MNEVSANLSRVRIWNENDYEWNGIDFEGLSLLWKDILRIIDDRYIFLFLLLIKLGKWWKIKVILDACYMRGVNNACFIPNIFLWRNFEWKNCYSSLPPLFLSKLFPYISSVNVSSRNFFFFFWSIKNQTNWKFAIYISLTKYSIIQIPIISFRDSSSLQFSTYNANGKQRKNWSAKYFINDRSMGSIAIKIFKEKEKREKKKRNNLEKRRNRENI